MLFVTSSWTPWGQKAICFGRAQVAWFFTINTVLIFLLSTGCGKNHARLEEAFPGPFTERGKSGCHLDSALVKWDAKTQTLYLLSHVPGDIETKAFWQWEKLIVGKDKNENKVTKAHFVPKDSVMEIMNGIEGDVVFDESGTKSWDLSGIYHDTTLCGKHEKAGVRTFQLRKSPDYQECLVQLANDGNNDAWSTYSVQRIVSSADSCRRDTLLDKWSRLYGCGYRFFPSKTDDEDWLFVICYGVAGDELLGMTLYSRQVGNLKAR